jgi:hypothetical protein
MAPNISSRAAFPWFRWWPSHPAVEIQNLTVKQGEVANFQICARPSFLANSAAMVMVTNTTTNASRLVAIPRPAGFTSLGASVKWVVEDPANDLAGTDRTKFPAFDELVFSGCTASTSSGRVMQSKDAALINLVINGVTICKAEFHVDEIIGVGYQG